MVQRETLQTRPSSSATQQSGLVLDEYLAAIGDARRRFALPAAKFGLREIQDYAGAKRALTRIVDLAIRRHGTSIYTKPHPLLAGLGEKVYSGRVVTPAYSGHRVRVERREDVLRRTIEVGVQTVVQLPSRHVANSNPRKQLKAAARAFTKAVGLASAAVQQEDVRRRIQLYFAKETEGRSRLLRGLNEMRWCGEALEGISNLKVKKLSLDSRNPQVSMALYMANWFQSVTGEKRYTELSILLEGAFSAADRATPAWVGRLAIEMHARRRNREAWMRRISSRRSALDIKK